MKPKEPIKCCVTDGNSHNEIVTSYRKSKAETVPDDIQGSGFGL